MALNYFNCNYTVSQQTTLV